MEQVVQLLGFQAQIKKIDLLVEIDDEVPISMMTDQGRLRQILINLISNAIKFT